MASGMVRFSDALRFGLRKRRVVAGRGEARKNWVETKSTLGVSRGLGLKGDPAVYGPPLSLF